MRAIQFYDYGDYDSLKLVNIPMPVLPDDKLLVKITMAAINQTDNTIRLGYIPRAKKLPMIPGNEGAGVIIKGNNEFPIGTRVIVSCFTPEGDIRGIVSDGTWQEYLALTQQELIKIPDNVSDEEAAAFPVGFFSAQASLNRADFSAGKSVLSLAVGGAVGNAGIQLAKAQGASLVITTAGSSSKTAIAIAAGFDNIIDLSKETISEGVKRITKNQGIDIVLDSLGGSITSEAIHSLARNGIQVVIGYSAGTQFNANITDFVWKGLQMRGQSLSGWFTEKEQKKIWDKLIPLLASGKIKPIIARIFNANKAAEAQRFLIEDRPFGKVLIQF